MLRSNHQEQFQTKNERITLHSSTQTGIKQTIELTVQVRGEYNTHHEIPTTSTNKKVMRLASTYN